MKTKVLTTTMVGALLAGCALSVISSCKKAPVDDRPIVVVSINPQRNILEKIAGDDFQIYTLLPNGENPETYDPAASGRKTVSDADLYFTTGFLTFEGNLKFNNSSITKFIDTSEGIEPIYGTHGHAKGSNEFLSGVERRLTDADPHVWTSIKNAKIITKNIANGLAELNPDNAELYHSRANIYIHHLDSLDKATASVLDSATIKSFLVWHPTLSYFARDYGLNQIAVGHETKEPSASGLRDVIDKARHDSVKVFFYQKSVDSQKAEAIGASIGASMHMIDPLNYDWEETLTNVAEAISQN